MRTTINLDDDLLAEAKATAARRGQTLARLVEDAVRESLLRRRTPGRDRIVLPTARGGLRPGVNLDDNSALLDLMEADDAPV